MANRIENDPINNVPEYVIDGFEAGIADSPETGIADMRCISNDTQPSVALANYALQSTTNYITGTVTSASTVNNTITVSTAVPYGSPIQFSGVSLPGGVNISTLYYAYPASGSGTSSVTFRLAAVLDPSDGFTALVTITSTGTGSFETIPMARPTGYATDAARNGQSFNYYVQDSIGQIWVNLVMNSSNYGTNFFTLLPFGLASSGGYSATAYPSNAHRNGIAFFNQFLFAFADAAVYAWAPYGAVALSTYTATAVINSGATSATLRSSFTLEPYLNANTSITAITQFSTGEIRNATYAQGETTMTWSPGLANNNNDAFTIFPYYQWNSSTFPLWATAGSAVPHPTCVSQNGELYYGDTSWLGSFSPAGGANPSNVLSATGAISPAATSATLTADWEGLNGYIETTFSSGETKQVLYTNGSTSISWTPGTTFANSAVLVLSMNPYQPLTIEQNMTVVQLPLYEQISALIEPSISSGSGNFLYIGTSTSNLIYPFEENTVTLNGQTGAVVDPPLVLPEIGTFQMLNINKLVYILAGQRGRVYYTNGTTAIPLKTIPKYPSGNPYSLWNWGGIMTLNNKLCFGAADTTVTGAAQNNASGMWSITLAEELIQLNSMAGAIRYEGQPSAGYFNANVLIPFPDGIRYFAGWYNGTNGGIDLLDIATPTFYTYNASVNVNQGSYLITDAVPIGTSKNPKTITVVEVKLDEPLISGESLRLSMRSDVVSAWTQVFVFNTAGALNYDNGDIGTPVQAGQWVQFKAELQTVSEGSFVRLREIRFRI